MQVVSCLAIKKSPPQIWVFHTYFELGRFFRAALNGSLRSYRSFMAISSIDPNRQQTEKKKINDKPIFVICLSIKEATQTSARAHKEKSKKSTNCCLCCQLIYDLIYRRVCSSVMDSCSWFTLKYSILKCYSVSVVTRMKWFFMWKIQMLWNAKSGFFS